MTDVGTIRQGIWYNYDEYFKGPVEKVDNLHEQMEKFRTEMKTLRKKSNWKDINEKDGSRDEQCFCCFVEKLINRFEQAEEWIDEIELKSTEITQAESN